MGFFYFRTMLLDVHPDNPNPRNIAKAIEVLKKGGVIIYPTDTVYAFGCDINSKNAVEKIKSIPNIIQISQNGGSGAVREFVEIIIN